LGKDLGVRLVEPDAQERQAQRDQRQHRNGRNRCRAAHHEPRESIPEAGLVGARIAIRAPLQKAGRERIHPRPEHGQDCG
jgi:hypothetical protein